MRWTGLYASGLSWGEILRSLAQGVRLALALGRAARTFRYRVRMVRWLRADVGFLDAAPLRSLTDHRRRAVYFDHDAMIGAADLARHPAVLDEARHIRERIQEARAARDPVSLSGPRAG